MKLKSLLFVTTVFFLPAFAFAGQKNSANVSLDRTVKVAGTQLAPGRYKLTWEGNGPDVTVSFLEGNKTIVTAPAKLVNTPANQPEGIETITEPDKSNVLQVVYSKNVSIQLEDATSGAGN